jgi:hypothetical protein
MKSANEANEFGMLNLKNHFMWLRLVDGRVSDFYACDGHIPEIVEVGDMRQWIETGSRSLKSVSVMVFSML